MSGLSDYAAKGQLGFITGQGALAAPAGVWLVLMTAVDTDAGTGGTEVTGGAYARQQVAGSLACTSTTASTAITLSSTAPAWLLALGTSGSGTTVWSTAGVFIGTVTTISGTAVTLGANAAVTGQTTIFFSAFGQPSGSAPSTTTNGTIITFPQATASWGTVIAFELRDAVTSGNLLAWDFMGNFSWLPFEAATASGNTLQVKANGYASNDPIVFTAEYGGTLPTLSAGTITGYTVNFVGTPATDTATILQTSGGTAITLSSTGSGAVRKILQQPIAINVTASFAASTLTITSA
jgi:hypothetical protein